MHKHVKTKETCKYAFTHNWAIRARCRIDEIGYESTDDFTPSECSDEEVKACIEFVKNEFDNERQLLVDTAVECVSAKIIDVNVIVTPDDITWVVTTGDALTRDEFNELMEFVTSQCADGIGASLEQHAVFSFSEPINCETYNEELEVYDIVTAEGVTGVFVVLWPSNFVASSRFNATNGNLVLTLASNA